MTTLDVAVLRSWIGRRETLEDRCDVRKVVDLAATLDCDAAPRPGERLPPGWHWMFFNPMVRTSELGPDGHPKRGGFLPPVPLPRRMWAGGRLSFRAPIPVGSELRRYSEIASVEPKQGRSGAMVFVVIRHRIFAGDVFAIEEEHDIVYREAASPGAIMPPGAKATSEARWQRTITPDPVLLFRYSALTANGHRIHYDHPYVTRTEGYPGLVFHGPLTARLDNSPSAIARRSSTPHRLRSAPCQRTMADCGSGPVRPMARSRPRPRRCRSRCRPSDGRGE